MRKFGSKRENAGQLNHPSGVTYLNDDYILVADKLNHRIQQFNVHTGNFLKAFGKYRSGEGEFLNPRGVCVDGDGRVAVTDRANNKFRSSQRMVNQCLNLAMAAQKN